MVQFYLYYCLPELSYLLFPRSEKNAILGLEQVKLSFKFD